MTDTVTTALQQLHDLPIGYLANISQHSSTTQFSTVPMGAPLSYHVLYIFTLSYYY
jgi:phosphoserine aminotransferase